MKWDRELDRFPGKEEAIDYLMKSGRFRNRTLAESYLKLNIPTEPHSQNDIIKHLKRMYKSKCFVWKAAAGPYSVGGIPDVLMIMDGKFYGFEVKRPYFGVVSPLQEQTIKKFKAMGAYAGVVVFPEDVDRIIKEANDVR